VGGGDLFHRGLCVERCVLGLGVGKESRRSWEALEARRLYKGEKRAQTFEGRSSLIVGARAVAVPGVKESLEAGGVPGEGREARGRGRNGRGVLVEAGGE
jgi:hypothetical protein